MLDHASFVLVDPYQLLHDWQFQRSESNADIHYDDIRVRRAYCPVSVKVPHATTPTARPRTVRSPV